MSAARRAEIEARCTALDARAEALRKSPLHAWETEELRLEVTGTLSSYAQDLRDLLAELRRREWQPIETAPKDGAPIDLWCIGDASDIEFYCPTHRRHRNRVAREGRAANVSWKDEAWRPISGLRLYPLSVRPTHWQPQPEAPDA